ncbi:MAG: type II toxin-antitoxin system VapB family antitoxin [Clostridiaceae bacterium]|jgi:Arc/MetJ family transcription regulator|nr:type II toxin-antitoxin system VapB family antitoxin [Clostridiaceae bacterium]
MRTNIDLDDKLVEEAFELSSAKTKKELIHMALEEFIENRKRLNLMDLYGKIQFDEHYDYRKMREGK